MSTTWRGLSTIATCLLLLALVWASMPPQGLAAEAKRSDRSERSAASVAKGAGAGDAAPPETSIEEKPAARTGSTDAAFTYQASERGSTFECKLDNDRFRPCGAAGQGFHDLRAGKHRFQVRATDAAGNVDPTPADHAWTVDTTAPKTTIKDKPAAQSGSGKARFTYGSSEPGSTFECALDGVGFRPCRAAGQTYVELAEGKHVFKVRAIDAAGNADSTPARHAWTVAGEPVMMAAGTAAAPLTFAAEADARVESANPDTNYGAAAVLTVDKSPLAETYLRFSVSGVTGTVTGATLRLRAYNGTDNAPKVYAVPDNTWTEAGLIWATKPARTGRPLADAGAFIASGSSPVWVEYDVTVAVTGDGTYTFSLPPDSSNGADFRSREYAAGDRPQLVLTVQDGGGSGDTPPETTIDSGPPRLTSQTTAAFAFSADDPAAAFECALDARPWEQCASPKDYAGLADGAHAFAVRAVDADGNADPTPAEHAWTVDATAPTIAGVMPAAGATGAAVGADAEATFSEAMDPATLTAATFTLAPQGGAAVTAAVTYDAVARKATLNPNADLSPGTTYTATVTTRAKDAAGNPLATASSWSFTTAAATPPPGQLTFAAAADAKVDRGSPSTNYGATADLTVDTVSDLTNDPNPSPQVESYLKFAVGGVDGTVTRATLRLRAYNGTNNGPKVYQTDTAWTEAGLTWGTKPARTGAPLADAGAIAATATSPAWVEYDVTALVAGNATYAFILAPDSGDAAQFRSRESAAAGDRPQLVLTVQDGGSTPETAIITGPPRRTNQTTAVFAFSANVSNATFECNLDGGDWEPCTPPTTYPGLAEGTHTFCVRSADAAGNVDPSPACSTWTVDLTAPTVAAVAPADGATGVVNTTCVEATFSEAIDPAALTWWSGFTLAPPGGSALAANVSYDAASRKATLCPASAPAAGTYVATVKGGAEGVRDLVGNALAADHAWSLTTAAAAPGPLTFFAVDAKVDSLFPSTNYGAALDLTVDGSPQVETYLKVAVSGVTGTVTGARLRLRAYNGTDNGPKVYAIPDTTWSETGITWNAKPARSGAPLADVGAIAASSTSPVWVEYDVTAVVTGDGTYSFNLVADSGDAAQFRSREYAAGGGLPQLVLTVQTGGGGDTVSPTVESTVPTDGATSGPVDASADVVIAGAMDLASLTTATMTRAARPSRRPSPTRRRQGRRTSVRAAT